MRREYLTDEYDEKLDEFVAAHPDLTRETVEQAYLGACEKFDDVMKEDAPTQVIRRLAYRQVEWNPPTEGSTATAESEVVTGANSEGPREAGR